jgi:hypothetical protein
MLTFYKISNLLKNSSNCVGSINIRHLRIQIGSTVAPASQVRASAMLQLRNIGNETVRHLS